MKVRIGGVTIPDAQVKRFIDLRSGLPLSMIQVSYEGEGFRELGEAFQQHTLLPFECDIIKTKVLVHGSSHEMKEKKHSYTLLERAMDVSCGYKLIGTEVGNEKAIIVPENTRDIHLEEMHKLRELPFVRFILEKDMTKDMLK